MKTRVVLGLSTCALALSAWGCGGGSIMPGNDTGTGGVDSGTGGTDTGVPSDAFVADDMGTPGDDTGVDGGGDDAATADAGSDVGPTSFPDGAIMCLAGVECTNFADAIGAAARGAAGATVDQARANCVVQMHRADCCGAQRAYGVNHGSRTDLCAAESACDSMYPTPPGCTSMEITTDTGEVTTNPLLVRVRAVNPSSCTFGTCYDCETFLCNDASCAGFGGISVTQCGP